MADNLRDRDALHAELLDLLRAFGMFGKTACGGYSRLAASAEEKQARDHLCHWLKSNDFTVLTDRVGNIFGALDLGTAGSERYFFCGSHLDSQPEGGNYDGCLGVVCACIGALYLRDRIARQEIAPTYRYYVVTCWTGEEGARFQPSLIGSSVFAGALDLADAWALRDSNGIRLKDALRETGYLGSDDVPRPDHYLELHIEQGLRLKAAGDAVGLVEACWGAEKIRLLVKGRADHTGPTAMADRRNALLAAARVIVEVEAISQKCPETLFSSVGRMELHPNSPNTVVGRAELWIEFRSISQAALDGAVASLQESLKEIGRLTGCDLARTGHERRQSVPFDAQSLVIAAQALDDAAISYQRLPTIAGHDAVRMQAICPSTLLFVPSKDGITHSPDEFTTDEDICAGFDGMTVVLSALISQPGTPPVARRSMP